MHYYDLENIQKTFEAHSQEFQGSDFNIAKALHVMCEELLRLKNTANETPNGDDSNE